MVQEYLATESPAELRVARQNKVFTRLTYFITSVVQFMVYSSYREIESVLFYLPNETNVKIVSIKCILIKLS